MWAEPLLAVPIIPTRSLVVWGRETTGQVVFSTGGMPVVKPGELVTPMEPKPYDQAFDDRQFAFQIKWDGVRIVAHVEHGRVMLQNRRGRNRTGQYPEIVESLEKAQLPPVILDGEIITLVEGKPNFPQLMRRDRASKQATINALVKTVPVVYVLFDILYRDEPLTNFPFYRRDQILRETVEGNGLVSLTDTFREQGLKVFAAVKAQGLEGIVAKRLGSRYHFGKGRDDWRKIKAWRRLQAVIGGFIPGPGGGVGAFLLGVPGGHGLGYIGRVAASLPQFKCEEITVALAKLVSERCPFNPVPQHLPNGFLWVKPVWTVEVNYLEWSAQGYLRHPVLVTVKPPGGTTVAATDGNR